MSKQLNLKKTKKALKNIIYGLAFEMSDSSLPEVSHFELANFEVKLHLDKSLCGKEYVELSYSWNYSKTDNREHDEIIQFCLSEQDNSIKLLGPEFLPDDVFLEESEFESIWVHTDYLLDIIESNKLFSDIAIPEIITTVRNFKVDSLTNEKKDEPRSFKSLNRFQKHLHLNGFIKNFFFNNQQWVMSYKCEFGEKTVYKAKNGRGRIEVFTEDFFSVVGYKDARVKLCSP